MDLITVLSARPSGACPSLRGKERAMTSMTHPRPVVIMGVDTHQDTHHVAVVDQTGRHLGDTEVMTDPAGYAAALGFAREFGDLAAAGVEGTGSYGVGIATFLTQSGVSVLEVNRPDRAERRRVGKSDAIDAYAAAQAVASGRAQVIPKTHMAAVEAIRVLHVTRRSAVKAHTQALNQLKMLVTTAPTQLRQQLAGLSTAALVTTCARLRPAGDLTEVPTATKTAMKRAARRCQHLAEEIAEAETDLDSLTRAAAPTLRDQLGIGSDVAAKLLITAGDNPERLHSEAAFARLCGAAPIPASSGRTDKHRLNPGGDRHANNALHTITLTRQRRCARTRTYTQRRTTEGLKPRDIRRCLKRLIAREIYPILLTDLNNLTT